jgi:hypothetical protein
VLDTVADGGTDKGAWAAADPATPAKAIHAAMIAKGRLLTTVPF